ncbi:MAG: NUDIX hydrolase [Gammaproteobacteria bacterium]|nr:NUDIX hydrolase [Gammaproteobacteria bacterium]MDH5652267.1 NUDIX hydrolase [Gammaproteobacteria bacterium]
MQDNLHVTVAAIAVNEDRFLMVHESIQGKSVYNQPAGHLEENESLPEAVVRECLEETAWLVKPAYITGIYQWTHPVNQQTFLRVCYFVEQYEKHDRPLDKEIIAAVWFTRDELVQEQANLRSPLVLRCIDDYLAGRRYPLDLITHLT